MLQTLRKNNKKILAVVGVLLMIAFLASDARWGDQSQGRSGKDLVGKMGDEPVRVAEWERARGEWELITKHLGIRQTMPGFDGRPREDFLSIAEIELFNRLVGAMQQQPMIAFSAARQIVQQTDHTTYLLLLREARKMDIHPGRDVVQTALTNIGESGVDPVAREQAVTNWLTVMAAFDRVASAPKVTPAHALRMAARMEQQIALQLVEFRAEQFMKDVPEPARAQLEEFFSKYRNDDAQTSESGFGYRYPNRVRIQYFRIPRDKLKATVTLEDVYGHFRNNPSRYEEDPTTQPATLPTTREALGPDFPATRPATQASTRPAVDLSKLTLAERFKQLPEKARDRIKDDISYQMAEQMANAIRQRFASDWPNYRMAAKAAGTLAPTDFTSALGVPFHQYTYLIRVREQIQRMKESRGVMPETAEEGSLLSRRQLDDLPGIGQSFAFENYGRVSFSEYAVGRAEPFLSEERHKQHMESREQTLALMQASPPLRDNNGNLYIFRLTAAETSHPPQSFEEVETKVRNDWRTNEAMKKAKDAAKLLVESARTRGGLQQALNASASQLKLVTTPLFAEGTGTIEGYKPGSENATSRFTSDAFKLLAERVRSGNEHPLDVFEVPQASVVIAARLENAKPTTKDAVLDLRVAFGQQMIERQRQAQMLMQWIQPKNVTARVNFVPAEAQEEKKTPGDPADRQPLNPLRGG